MAWAVPFCVAVCAWGLCAADARAESEASVRAHILIVVGPSNHPPGSHEVAAGARLIAHCLEHAENVRGLAAHVSEGWPTDPSLLDTASTIVFIGDTYPPARLEQSARIMTRLSGMMDRGVGMVCIHYATGLRAEDVALDGDHPLLRWIGGYFATRCRHHQSVAKIVTATITPTAEAHPVLRGWNEFRLTDEPYYNNYFGPHGLAANVTPLATALLPPDDPQEEIVAWCVERRGGGRGMGIVMPHFYRSWNVDDLRTCIMNGIVWTARLDVPVEGVQTTLPDLESFAPESVEPQPRKR